MGDYRFRDDTSNDSTGIIRVADGAIIPVNLELASWQDYLTWKAVPNTPDAANATNLAGYKRKRKTQIDQESDLEFRKQLRMQLPSASGSGFWLAAVLEELYRYEADGTPTAAEYPLMNALIGVEGASLANVATAMRTWWDGIKTVVGAIGKERWSAHKDINAAANLAAVDAVTVSWPASAPVE